MGITIGDTITLHSGLTANNSYGSFGKSELIIEKVGSDYLVTCKGRIWANQTARNNNKSQIFSKNVSITINSSQLSGNFYSLLYTQWKSNYSSVSDVL